MNSSYIHQLLILKFDSFTWIEGSILKGTQRHAKLNRLLRTLLNFFIFPKNNSNRTIQINKEDYSIRTDQYGKFHLKLSETEIDTIRYENYTRNKSELESHTYDYSTERPLVISDIDDTLIKSFSTNLWKRLKTLFFVKLKKRKGINYSQNLIDYLNNKGAQFIFLSRSEENLLPLLKGIFAYLGYPYGLFFLSPWKSFNNVISRKSKKLHKEHHLEFIISNTNSNLILIGDDTQKDAQIYLGLKDKYPERISHIFIHSVNSKHPPSPTPLIHYFKEDQESNFSQLQL